MSAVSCALRDADQSDPRGSFDAETTKSLPMFIGRDFALNFSERILRRPFSGLFQKLESAPETQATFASRMCFPPCPPGLAWFRLASDVTRLDSISARSPPDREAQGQDLEWAHSQTVVLLERNGRNITFKQVGLDDASMREAELK